MAVKPRVDLFFDVISPYSWIAFEGITRYSVVWPIDLHYKPFNFAAVVKDNPGAPLKNPAKAWYLYHDIDRAAKHWDLEIRMPKDHQQIIFTKSSSPAMRLLNGFLLEDNKNFVPMSRALWRRFYYEGRGIFEDSELLEAMRDLKIERPEAMLELSKTDQIKQMLRDHTKEAIDGKSFGAPWFHVHTPKGSEYFFGSDSIPLIADSLKLLYRGPIKSS